MQTNSNFALISKLLRHIALLSVPKHERPNCRYGDNCRFASRCYYNHANHGRTLYTHSLILQLLALLLKPNTPRSHKRIAILPTSLCQSTSRSRAYQVSPVHPQAKIPTQTNTATTTAFASSNQFNLLYDLSDQGDKPTEEQNSEDYKPWIAVTHQKRRNLTKQTAQLQFPEPPQARCKSCLKELYLAAVLQGTLQCEQ